MKMSDLTGWSRRLGQLATVGVTTLVLAGCYPGEAPISDVIVTLYDTGKDFKTSYTTFALPDSVVDVGDPTDDGYIEYDHRFGPTILGRIRSNLTARGWQEIPEDEISDTNRPDVVVLATALLSKNTAVSGYPPYWGWWPGWGYYPPGWGYPCCWTVVQYNTGTISIEMAEDPDQGDEVLVIPWAGRLNGLLSSSNSDSQTRSRLERSIDQAFAQSPYLDIN